MKGKAARDARAAGQSLAPTVFVGREGLTDAHGQEARAQLRTRGLVKARIAPEAAAASSARAVGEALAALAHADLVEVRGFTVLLARPDRRRGP